MIDNLIHFGDDFKQQYGNILDRCGKGKELSISFLPGLDDKIWGLKKKKLVVVGGRPSMGKSTLMLQLAFSFAEQGKSVVFFTLEMPNALCFERLLCNQCEINNYLTTTGQLSNVHFKYENKVADLEKKMARLKLVFIESMGKTFPEIHRIIEEFKKPVDAVFIDYIQMIKSVGGNKKDAIDEYIKKLREYAIKKDFCAIVGSQINRGTYDKKKVALPEMWELKGTGDLEEHCDQCFLVHWDWWYSREEEDKEKYWIRLAKNRDGRTGTANCIFKPEYYKITEEVNEQITHPGTEAIT